MPHSKDFNKLGHTYFDNHRIIQNNTNYIGKMLQRPMP